MLQMDPWGAKCKVKLKIDSSATNEISYALKYHFLFSEFLLTRHIIFAFISKLKVKFSPLKALQKDKACKLAVRIVPTWNIFLIILKIGIM